MKAKFAKYSENLVQGDSSTSSKCLYKQGRGLAK